MRLTILVLALFGACAQAAELDAFDAWHGAWSGTVTSTSPGGRTLEFPMSLAIDPHENDKQRLSWTITYGEGERRDERPYELLAVDHDRGHYRIDEKNSIELDAYLTGDTLTSVFEVQDSRLAVCYTLVDETIEFSIVSYAAEPLATTGGDNAPEVRSFRVVNVQHARLERN